MTPSPIPKVLSTLSSHAVRHLLMGGQACVFYGAAEFSRDTDIVLLADQENLHRLRAALEDLAAERIAVPPLELDYLSRGHAVHFRCRREDVSGMRLDVMSVMRGVDPFRELWERRTTVQLPEGLAVELLSLPDLVQAKKTQRDKDWPMLRRLVEAHYAQHENHPAAEHVRFWLREARTPALLVRTARRYPADASAVALERPLLVHTQAEEAEMLERALEEEARGERARDREYWRPLIRELEALRHQETRRRHAESMRPEDEGYTGERGE